MPPCSRGIRLSFDWSRAGRLVKVKGFDLLIGALALLHDTQVRLTILGAGPLRASLERLAHTKGVAGRVRFAGFQANPYTWFARADAFVLSSRYEGLPNVVLEALGLSHAGHCHPGAGRDTGNPGWHCGVFGGQGGQFESAGGCYWRVARG